MVSKTPSKTPDASTADHRSDDGDQAKRDTIARMLRVDHAGEYGAVRIYEGQLSVLHDHVHASELRHMLDQEYDHLAAFNGLLAERQVRPSALSPLWHAAGYALGAATAAMGVRTAMACTVAVEEVIDEHYAAQEKTLALISDDPEDRKIGKKIAQFRAEELEHRDIAIQREAEKAPFYPVISAGIKGVSRLAIWLSERF